MTGALAPFSYLLKYIWPLYSRRIRRFFKDLDQNVAVVLPPFLLRRLLLVDQRFDLQKKVFGAFNFLFPSDEKIFKSSANSPYGKGVIYLISKFNIGMMVFIV